MAKKKKTYTKIQCTVCKKTNYLTQKSKKAAEVKLEMQKFCKHCRKTTKHKETKR